MADGDDGCRPEQEPGPEPGEEFEIVDRSQVPGPGELRRATKGWSAPILTLARRATGTLSASCGSALRAAASLSGAESGADDVVRAASKGQMMEERVNLMHMMKLSIKVLLQSALSLGRSLDADHAPLQQFFVVLEHCLKHGLRVKKSFIGQNKSFFGPLELVEKLCPEASEKELELQIGTKTEMEIAMKLLEKDTHEKQDTLVALRQQLEEVKAINLQMFHKVQNAESSLQQKNEVITSFEEKANQVMSSMKQVEERLQHSERARQGAEERSRKLQQELSGRSSALQQQLAQLHEQCASLEKELKSEKEQRQALQRELQHEKDTSSLLRAELQQVEGLKKELRELQDEKAPLPELRPHLL